MKVKIIRKLQEIDLNENSTDKKDKSASFVQILILEKVAPGQGCGSGPGCFFYSQARIRCEH